MSRKVPKERVHSNFGDFVRTAYNILMPDKYSCLIMAASGITMGIVTKDPISAGEAAFGVYLGTTAYRTVRYGYIYSK